MACRRFALTALVTLLAGAGGVRAQPSLEVLDAGKPVAGMPVLAILDDGKPADLGVTRADGTISIDMSATDFEVGEEIGAWVQVCEDGEEVLIFVRRGHPIPEDEDCDDPVLVGYFQWGGQGILTVDIGDHNVGYDSRARGMPGGAATSSYALGVGFDLLQMLELLNVLEEVNTGATDHDATGWAPGFQLFVEWRYGRIVAIGVEGGYSRMETEIRFAQGVQTGDLDYYRAGVSAKLGPPNTGRFWPYGTIGWYRAWNKGDFEIDGLSDHRVHKTSLVGIGAGFDYLFRPGWGGRVEGLYSSTFEDPDADEHIRWKFGLFYLTGGEPVRYAQERGGLHE